MAVSPAQHAEHTAGIQATRSSFGLGKVKTIASDIGNNIKTNVSNIKNNAEKFVTNVKENGVHPFALSDMARGNVKP